MWKLESEGEAMKCLVRIESEVIEYSVAPERSVCLNDFHLAQGANEGSLPWAVKCGSGSFSRVRPWRVCFYGSAKWHFCGGAGGGSTTLEMRYWWCECYVVFRLKRIEWVVRSFLSASGGFRV